MESSDAEVPVADMGAGVRARDAVAAIVTGQLAGLAMLATMMIFAALEGMALLDPLRAIGSIVFGVSGLRPGAETVWVGLIVHQFVFSLFWSLVFAALVQQASRRNLFSVTALGFGDPWGAAILGLLVGMTSNLLDVVIVMPAIAQDAAWIDMFLGLKSWFCHFVFGVVLATFPWVRQSLFPPRT
ncbi:MAG: hypothetical protein ACK4YP_18295 [Myxococcota bacterium]